MSLSTTHFVPEQDRWLVVTGNTGGSASFNGVGSGGLQLPNGYYTVQVQLPGGGLIQRSFYLEHQAWNGGSLTARLPVRGDHALIMWNYAESVNVRIGLYDLAGELVWLDHGVGISGQIRWDLKTTGGSPVAQGIYLVKVDASSLDGSVEDVRILKMAVLR